MAKATQTKTKTTKIKIKKKSPKGTKSCKNCGGDGVVKIRKKTK